MLSAQLIRDYRKSRGGPYAGRREDAAVQFTHPLVSPAFPDELHRRLYDVYHGLGRWLLENTEQTIQAQYEELGKQRCREGIPFSEVLWALVLTKDHLRDSVGAFMLADSALDLLREQEIYRLIGHFFDRAICYAAEAYEREASRRGHEARAAGGQKSARDTHGTPASLAANR